MADDLGLGQVLEQSTGGAVKVINVETLRHADVSRMGGAARANGHEGRSTSTLGRQLFPRCSVVLLGRFHSVPPKRRVAY